MTWFLTRAFFFQVATSMFRLVVSLSLSGNEFEWNPGVWHCEKAVDHSNRLVFARILIQLETKTMEYLENENHCNSSDKPFRHLSFWDRSDLNTLVLRPGLVESTCRVHMRTCASSGVTGYCRLMKFYRWNLINRTFNCFVMPAHCILL